MSAAAPAREPAVRRDPRAAQRAPAPPARARPVDPLAAATTPGVALQRCACGGGCPACRAKAAGPAALPIHPADDVYERPADGVADAVTRPDPFAAAVTTSASNAVSRLRRGASGAEGAGTAPPIVHAVLREAGEPLDAEALAYFEPRFGRGLGDVRVHTGARAAESAQAVHALAYTVGRDVVFGAGAYRPGSAEGRRLIAHELAHVVQQGGGTAPPSVQRRELPDGTTTLTSADWTTSDREQNTQRWKAANLFNLNANDYGQYRRVPERADFYLWFYNHTAAMGYTTRWALAAHAVASGADALAYIGDPMEGWAEAAGVTSDELQGMMREGNQVIFDNVFPKLRALLAGGPLTGPSALDWDMQILSEEQQLIQPLYRGASASARAQLDDIARQQGLAGAGAPLLGPEVEPGPYNLGGPIPAFAEPDLLSVQDRWTYGMRLGNHFTPGGTAFVPGTSIRPTPSAAYTTGAALVLVRTRPHLHQLDAALDEHTGNRAAIVALLSQLTVSEQQELLRDQFPDGGLSYSARLAPHLNRSALIGYLSTWTVGLPTQLAFLGGFLNDRWSSVDYGDVAPIIQAFPQAQRNLLHTPQWMDIFIQVCDDSTIVTAVNDLGLVNPMRQHWIDEERSWW